MPTPPPDERMLTELDFVRLRKLLAQRPLPQLAALLSDAEVVPARAIPADVITMNSAFMVTDPETQQSQRLVLCYPQGADPRAGRISVLSPAGLGLIGLAAGALGRWSGPDGTSTQARIDTVLFQPEATGDYVT